MSIILDHVSHVYGEDTAMAVKALNDVNLVLPDGQFIGLIGHTGSGKSTLVQHLNGLMKATSGSVYFNGEDIDGEGFDKKMLRSKVGLVFQYPEYQIFEETVFKDIAFGPKNMGLSEAEIKRRVYETAENIGLSQELMERSPFELSGGQKRRVAIAGVMAMEPKVLILDEPTAGLDPKGRDKILNRIKSYHEKTGNTVLIVSHSMEDIAKFADKILVMNKSELFCYDTAVNVFRRSKEIEQMGLDVPQITKVFNGLKERGIDLGKEVFTVNYAKDLILKTLNKGGLG